MEYSDQVMHLRRAASEAKRAGDYPQALMHREALRQLYAGGGYEFKTRVNNLNMMAYLALKLQRYDDAESFARDALQMVAAAQIAPGDTTATHTAMLASILAERGDFTQAAALMRRAIEDWRATPWMNTELIERREQDRERMLRREPGTYLD